MTTRDRAARAVAAFRSGGITGLATLIGQRFTTLWDERTRSLRRATRRALEFGVRPRVLRRQITHVHGPKTVAYGPDELLVITVVRNGALYVKSFVEHYQRLGVAHCVFLDTGSTDATVELLCAAKDVTVLRTDAPYAKFENTMKRYLAERFSSGRWNLCADIDELFDYPCSDVLPLRGFLQYLNHRGFTAVVAQMLDMFSDVPLADLRSRPEDDLKSKYRYYDTTGIDRRAYQWSQPVSSDVRMHWGGIRRAVFGTDNGLTKAVLVLMNGRVKPFVEWHHVTGARIADVTGILMHYPFVGAFADKVQDAVRSGRYGATTTEEYVAYAAALARDPRLTLKRPSAHRFTGLEPLIAEGFLAASAEYRDWVNTFAPRQSRPVG